MPGFMGLRGLDPKNTRAMERQRREESKGQDKGGATRRSEEKVHEILFDQQGDMSAYNGSVHDLSPACTLEHIGLASAMCVSDIMSARVAVLSFDDTLLTVRGIFSKVKFRHLPVVEEDGKIIGIISDRDYLRMESPFFGTVNEQTRDSEIMHRKVGTIMTRKPICAHADTSLLQAVQLMNERKISCLPIVERGTMCLQGIVTWKDVVRAFCPEAFNIVNDSSRLRSGVRINPPSEESVRLRDKASESARLRAHAAPAPQPSAPPQPSSDEPQPPAPPQPPPPSLAAHEGGAGVRTDTKQYPPPGRNVSE